MQVRQKALVLAYTNFAKIPNFQVFADNHPLQKLHSIFDNLRYNHLYISTIFDNKEAKTETRISLPFLTIRRLRQKNINSRLKEKNIRNLNTILSYIILTTI